MEVPKKFCPEDPGGRECLKLQKDKKNNETRNRNKSIERTGKKRMEKKLRIAMFGQKRLSREGGIEIVVRKLGNRMAAKGHRVTCYNRSGHHVSGAEYDHTDTACAGVRKKSVLTIKKKGLASEAVREESGRYRPRDRLAAGKMETGIWREVHPSG